MIELRWYRSENGERGDSIEVVVKRMMMIVAIVVVKVPYRMIHTALFSPLNTEQPEETVIMCSSQRERQAE